MSVIALCTPAMCSGVSGDALFNCNRSASARMSCIAIRDFRDAICCTQWTVGELSLNKATCVPLSCGHTCSMTSQRSRSPAISKSEFVIVPLGFASDTRAALMSSGHGIRNTVGGKARFSPMIMPPTPCEDASLTPMKSGHLVTKAAHLVGSLMESRRNVRHSISTAWSTGFLCR
jgi:hypothetical protein